MTNLLRHALRIGSETRTNENEIYESFKSSKTAPRNLPGAVLLCDKQMKFWCKVAALENAHGKEKAPCCVLCTHSSKDIRKTVCHIISTKMRYFQAIALSRSGKGEYLISF